MITHEDVLEQIRGGAEYNVAWDLELWRQHETAKATKHMTETQRRAEEALAERIKRADADASRARDRKMAEVRVLEEKHKENVSALEKKALALDERERELGVRANNVEKEGGRVNADAELRVQRVREEATLRAELDARRCREATDTVGRLQGRLEASEKDHARLWDEFASFKARQLSEGPVANAISGARQDVLAAAACHEAALARLSSEHSAEVRRLGVELREAHHQLSVARAHVHRLGGELRRAGASVSVATLPPPVEMVAPPPPPPPPLPALDSEVNRLRRERSQLLSMGVYELDSDVVRMLDRQIEDILRK